MGEIVKKYTLEEVKKNNGSDGSRVWVAIHDIVYDFTDYLEEHPGGGELITEYAGMDGTSGFDDFGHSGDAKSQMKQYKIGELVEEDKRANRKKKARAENAAKSGSSRRTGLSILCLRCC